MTEAGGDLTTALAAHGLCLRGWVDFGSLENSAQGTSIVPLAAPVLSTGEAARHVALVGYLGRAIWPAFATWQVSNPAAQDPLDRWSKTVISPIARAVGGEAAFPSDRPWRPFQQWAMAAEGLRPSPLGMLIHPLYGLWHGYRGAILFGESVSAGLSRQREASALRTRVDDAGAMSGEGAAAAAIRHPCDACEDKPCLSACPVDAFDKDGFHVAACRAYLKAEAGARGCMVSGCLARNACPVGREYRYGAAQIRFHMAAFG